MFNFGKKDKKKSTTMLDMFKPETFDINMLPDNIAEMITKLEAMRNTLAYSTTRDVKDPERGTDKAAGVDLFIPRDIFNETLYDGPASLNKDRVTLSEENKTITVHPNSSVLLPMGIKFNIPADTVLLAMDKSGVATKKGLKVNAGVIDEGYTGEIFILLINTTGSNITLSADDKIVQMVNLPINYPTLVKRPENELYETEKDRGDAGFGSTGS